MLTLPETKYNVPNLPFSQILRTGQGQSISVVLRWLLQRAGVGNNIHQVPVFTRYLIITNRELLSSARKIDHVFGRIEAQLPAVGGYVYHRRTCWRLLSAKNIDKLAIGSNHNISLEPFKYIRTFIN